jgi:hypothetical protein
MTGFEADADALTARAAEFPGLAERVGKIHSELSDALGTAGQCWGADSVGQSFATAHVGPSDATLGRLNSLPDQLGEVGVRFAGTGAAYRAQDSTGVTRLNATDGG